MTGKKIVLLEMPHSIWLAFPIMGELLEPDLMEAMNHLEALGEQLTNSAVWEEFKRLEKKVESFDTDGAMDSLKEIASALDLSLE